jgi:hypothetical protein
VQGQQNENYGNSLDVFSLKAQILKLNPAEAHCTKPKNDQAANKRNEQP